MFGIPCSLNTCSEKKTHIHTRMHARTHTHKRAHKHAHTHAHAHAHAFHFSNLPFSARLVTVPYLNFLDIIRLNLKPKLTSIRRCCFCCLRLELSISTARCLLYLPPGLTLKISAFCHMQCIYAFSMIRT